MLDLDAGTSMFHTPAAGAFWMIPVILCAGVGACALPASTFKIEDTSVNAQPRTYESVFHEAYFDIDRQGNLELVLRRVDESQRGSTPDTEQVIYLRSVWEPIPGRTLAESSQITAMATYVILSGRTGATYEGAGSLFFHLDKSNDVMIGKVDQAILKPRRKRTADSVLFEQVVLSGKFHARRDRRQVVRAANNIARIFGPLPPPMAGDAEK
jgi:hypothetical protein